MTHIIATLPYGYDRKYSNMERVYGMHLPVEKKGQG